MRTYVLIIIAILAAMAKGHFSIEYPRWRGGSMMDIDNQAKTPCANIATTDSTPRTPWPLTGGSLRINSMHKAAILVVSLAVADNATEKTWFNTTLAGGPVRETGFGRVCLPHVSIPADAQAKLRDGLKASLQVMTYGYDGQWTFNCADIQFSDSATLLPEGDCVNDTDVSAVFLAPVESAQGDKSSAASPWPRASVATWGLGAVMATLISLM